MTNAIRTGKSIGWGKKEKKVEDVRNYFVQAKTFKIRQLIHALKQIIMSICVRLTGSRCFQDIHKAKVIWIKKNYKNKVKKVDCPLLRFYMKQQSLVKSVSFAQ